MCQGLNKIRRNFADVASLSVSQLIQDFADIGAALAENRAAQTQERTRHQRQAMSKEYEEAFRDLIRSIRELQDQGRTDNEIIGLINDKYIKFRDLRKAAKAGIPEKELLRATKEYERILNEFRDWPVPTDRQSSSSPCRHRSSQKIQ